MFLDVAPTPVCKSVRPSVILSDFHSDDIMMATGVHKMAMDVDMLAEMVAEFHNFDWISQCSNLVRELVTGVG